MKNQQHPFPYPLREQEDMKERTMTEEDIAWIRSLIVAWSITETGAPTLMTRAGEELEGDYFDDHPERQELMLLFFSQAKLEKTRGVIHNPYFDEDCQWPVEEGVYGLTDKATAKLLQTMPEISLDIDEQLRQVWDSHILTPSGFDPKRGFMSGYRDIIDPDKKLSRGELLKARKRLVGGLFLYLQLFVQQGEISPGLYHTESGWVWAPGKLEIPTPELDKYQWIDTFARDFHYASEEYTQAMFHVEKLIPLMCEDSTEVSYDGLVSLLHLHHQYGYIRDRPGRYDIAQIDVINSGLKHFPEHISRMDFDLTLCAARIYNATGQYAQALKVLRTAEVDVYTDDVATFFNQTLPDPALQVAYFEGHVARLGLGELDHIFVKDWFVHRDQLDLRRYQNWEFRVDTYKIIDDLKEHDARHLFDHIAPIIMQLHVMNTLEIYGKYKK